MKETKNKGLIFFDKDTSFKGVIDAPQLVLEGSVEGAVVSSKTVLLRQGSFFEGEITTCKILAEEGAIHKGSLHLDGKRREPPVLEQDLFNNCNNGKVSHENGKTSHREEAMEAVNGKVEEKVKEMHVIVPSGKVSEPAVVEEPVVRLW